MLVLHLENIVHVFKLPSGVDRDCFAHMGTTDGGRSVFK